MEREIPQKPSFWESAKNLKQKLVQAHKPPPPKYAVIKTILLEQLMDTLNNGCALCKEKYTERQFSGDGHCLIISLNCVNNHPHTWANST